MMTNEIKEILFLLHNDRLTESSKRKLEDYITNLQEENERLEQIIDIRECQLEEMEMNKTDYTEVNILEMQLEDYKSRNEKAVEYCNNNIEFTPRLIDVIDILRGDE